MQHFEALQEENGYAYRSSELKVSFKSIYDECKSKAKEHFTVKPVDVEPEPAEAAEPEVEAEAFDPRAGYSGEVEEEAPAAPAPRVRGPQLPGATVGVVAEDSASESDAEAGPRCEGEEREGVDLRYVNPAKSRREEWMTTAPDSYFPASHRVVIFCYLNVMSRGM